MKKRFSILTAFLLILLTVTPAFAAMQEFQAAVMRWSGNYNADGSPGLTRATTGITFTVLATGSNASETIYYNKKWTAMPLTDRWVTASTFASTTYCGGQVYFWTDPTDATNDRYVDLIVTDTVGGFTTFVKNFDKYTHTIVIDERPNIEHHGIVPFKADSTSAKSTGVYFPVYTRIKNVVLEIINASAGTSAGTTGLNVGNASTSTGYINQENLGTTGFIKTSLASTGAFMQTGGVIYQSGYIATAITSIYYTAGTTEGIDGASTTNPSGYIHYWFTRMR